MQRIWKPIGRLTIIALISAMMVSVAFGAGVWAGRNILHSPSSALEALQAGATPTETSTRAAQFSLFWEAWEALESSFYGELPDIPEASRAAIRGLLQSLGDPNTALLTPEMARLFDEDISGQFEGIGASVRTDENGYFVIVHPYEGSPAAKAGIQPGDIVLEVDGKSTQGLSTSEVVAMIRGPRGSTVTLSIYRPSAQERLTIRVVREKIVIPAVEARLVDENIAHIRLREFNALAARQLRSALRTILDQQPKGLILDLRGNPGGLLEIAVAVASEFVGTGTIVEERFKDGTTNIYPALRGGLATNFQLPVVVLVNGASASASEIVAGAIQDTGRGILVGEKTFGKGSVQLPYKLSDGSQLRVTIAHWFTPKGRDIHKEGLEPDVVVPLTVEDYRAGNDPQLQRAVEILRTGTGGLRAARALVVWPV